MPVRPRSAARACRSTRLPASATTVSSKTPLIIGAVAACVLGFRAVAGLKVLNKPAPVAVEPASALAAPAAQPAPTPLQPAPVQPVATAAQVVPAPSVEAVDRAPHPAAAKGALPVAGRKPGAPLPLPVGARSTPPGQPRSPLRPRRHRLSTAARRSGCSTARHRAKDSNRALARIARSPRAKAPAPCAGSRRRPGETAIRPGRRPPPSGNRRCRAPGARANRPQPRRVEDEQHRPLRIAVERDLHGVARLGPDAELLLELARQRVARVFALLHLAAGKLPRAGQWLPALRCVRSTLFSRMTTAAATRTVLSEGFTARIVGLDAAGPGR